MSIAFINKLIDEITASICYRVRRAAGVAALMLIWATAAAQTDTIRFVKTTGSYQADGRSWNNAKNNIQDAINDLRDYLKEHNLKSGRVLVAAGRYTPTESTEKTGDGVLYTAFKVYDGISLYGGFSPDETAETDPDNRLVEVAEQSAPITFREAYSRKVSAHYHIYHETVLSGSHVGGTAFTRWNDTKKQYDLLFPGNSYHVVWFATNGFYEDNYTGDDPVRLANKRRMRARPLNTPATVDGFTITGGYASDAGTTRRVHNSYGGGAYLVQGATLSRCHVRENAAARRGGGVYLDGGGLVEYCNIERNQCVGLGVYEGYGGGVCVDYNGTVRHSFIYLNASRIGGGLAVTHEKTGNAAYLQPCANQGDVYWKNRYSPSVAACAVYNNTSAIEAGGVYMKEGGTANQLTVVRNHCAGQDIVLEGRRMGRSAGLYIDYTAVVFNSVMWGGTVGNANIQYAAYIPGAASQTGLVPQLNFTALSNSDITDWSGTSKNVLVPLRNENSATDAAEDGYFAGFVTPSAVAGVDKSLLVDNDEYLYNWTPTELSDLRGKGIRMEDYITAEQAAVSGAIVKTDIYGSPFSPRCMLGAICPLPVRITHAFVPSVENASWGAVPTLFVDPDRAEKNFPLLTKYNAGSSWDAPLEFVADALAYINENRNGTLAGNTHFQVLVKQGETTNAGSSLVDQLRSSAIHPTNSTGIYGGYHEALAGADISQRNPMKYPTVISADVSEKEYDRNAYHVVAFDGVSNAVVDGFYLYGGNAAGTKLSSSLFNAGAGVLVQNKTTGGNTMAGNILRNCFIANSTAAKGAGVYVYSDNGATVQLEMENCVVHNNTNTNPDSAAVTAEGTGAQISINHCMIRGNVGYAIAATGGAAAVINNSAIHANASRALDNITDLALAANADAVRAVMPGSAVTGANNIADRDAAISAALGRSVLTYLMADEGTYPKFTNPTINIGVTVEGTLTKYGGTPDFTPGNMNPMVNAADRASMSGRDMTTVSMRSYGGAADIGAVENTDQPENGKVIYVRDYKDPSVPGGDGSSWATAINGNSLDPRYSNTHDGHSFRGYDLEVYPAGTQLTGLQWAVDEAYYRSVKNTDGTITYRSMVVPGSNGIATDTASVKAAQRVEVWVAEGEYTRKDGFFMRNSVNVTGGFPATGNPGLKEREPKKHPTAIQTMTAAEHADLYAQMPQIPVAPPLPVYSYYDNSGWTVKYSSEEKNNEDGKATNVLVDGKSVFWHAQWNASAPSSYPHFLAFDMGGWQTLSHIKINNRNQNITTAYRVYTSSNANAWGRVRSENDLPRIMTGWTEQSFTILKESDHKAASSTDDHRDVLLCLDNPVSCRYFIVVFQSGNSQFAVVYEVNASADVAEEYVAPPVPSLPLPSVSGYDLNNYANAYKSGRVLTQQFPYYEVGGDTEKLNKAVNPYTFLTTWNGFAIRNGCVNIFHTKDGGAGLALRKNGKIENCVVRNNLNMNGNSRGGGVFCNDGTIANCVIEGNELSNDIGNSYAYGGGLYLRAGTVYNTVFCKNVIKNNLGAASGNDGAAVYCENGWFYNNTITENESTANVLTTGNWFSNGSLYIYNTIIYNNKSRNGSAEEMHIDPNVSFVTVKNCLLNSTRSHNVPAGRDEGMQYANGISPFVDAAGGNYRLISSSSAINSAYGEDLMLAEGIDLPVYDADYTERVKDCALDIGAYEYNGAVDITPDLVSAPGTALYYVTQNGAGSRSAADAANAACWEKLQKVLDAAGRYRLSNPSTPVTVRLAGFSGYCPRRSADVPDGSGEENPLSYSIVVPRGVTVEGGYSEDFTQRGTLIYPTVLTGRYNSDDRAVNVYHVVTFTEKTFDANGNEMVGKTLGDILPTEAKAVLDGLFITGGQAGGQADINGNAPHSNGGAAVVTPFAHVRNCIIYNNTASGGGGALYMQPGALVSGCIITGNHAANGGAVYVEEPEQAEVPADALANPAQLFTSTLVNNSARLSGGGIYFETNLRANSVAVWSNTANQQENVSGQTDPHSADSGVEQTADNYPINFCAVENMRLAGINNISVATEEGKGVRFDETKDRTTAAYTQITDISSEERFFYLKRQSMLARAGMSRNRWAELRAQIPTLEQYDLAGIDRANPAFADNVFIEIGARAFNGLIAVDPTVGLVMHRLFVAKPEKVNLAYAMTLQNNPQTTPVDNYYRQQGSTFANPMCSLDEALEYIVKVRKMALDAWLASVGSGKQPDAGQQELISQADAGFEIFMSGGTFYPSRTINGEYTYSRANTFVVPEGVSLYGGINPEYYYCADTEQPVSVAGVTLLGQTTAGILGARRLYDHNQNNIVEPWEMENQSVLSGQVVNSDMAENSYHVVRCMADDRIVGMLPQVEPVAGVDAATSYGQPLYNGKTVTVDGFMVSDGRAFNYNESVVDSKETFYKGGALCINGNWVYDRTAADSDMHNSAEPIKRTGHSRPVGVRNIPVEIRNCQFVNNMAGMGGAVYSDGQLTVYGSSFVQNYAQNGRALYNDGTPVQDGRGNNIVYSGRGGVFNASYKIHLINTLIANNEARYVADGSSVNPLNARGGAVVGGEYSSVQMLNSNVVRNKAQRYPAVFLYNPNLGYAPGQLDTDNEAVVNDVDSKNPHKFVNTIFWGNVADNAAPGTDEDYVVNYDAASPGEMLWFCAYESGRASEPVNADIGDNTDFRHTPYTIDSYIPRMFKKAFAAYPDADRVNNNILLNSDNAAVDGPNFITPSPAAGIDGHMPSADWMIGRINNLTDNGWTYLKQTVTTESATFDRDADGNPIGEGIYHTVAGVMNNSRPALLRMPTADDPYMYYDAANTRMMHRVSPDPNPSHHQTYIDIGVYEYQHIKLNPSIGQMTDTLWVCEREAQGIEAADGKTWLTATSDLQRAIETLLAERNGHHKVICMRSGMYQPVYTISDNLAFTVRTESLNNGSTAPQDGMYHGVKSLHIKGGFSNEIEGFYDIEKYPAVIYSPNRAGVPASMQNHIFVVADARQWTTSTQGNGNSEYKPADRVIPIVLDGLTLVNSHAQADGAALLYADQIKAEDGSWLLPPEPDEQGKAQNRLTLNRCTLTMNGAANTDGTAPATAVIGQGGGSALIVNTLFHSNRGNALQAYGTKVINSTFALNSGHVELYNYSIGADTYNSVMYNSLLWRNDLQTTFPVPRTELILNGLAYGPLQTAVVPTDGSVMHSNAISGFRVPEGADTDANNNEALSADNDDVIYGPNFMAPDIAASTPEAQYARNFRLRPSVKTVHKANEALYAGMVAGIDPGAPAGDILAAVAADTDLSGGTRLYDSGLERGAYECIANLRRVIYMNPNMVSPDNNGWTWEKAYGRGQLQKAIDAAAVYAYTSEPRQAAYVYVKGTDSPLGEGVAVRSGVSVIGAISPGFVAECQYQENADGTHVITDSQADEYLEKVLNARPGPASSLSARTIVEGVHTEGGATATEPSLIDGLTVTASKPQVKPVVLLDNGDVTLRNVVIADNTMIGHQPAVGISSGLIYNSLVRHNATPEGVPQVAVGQKGWMVNCTVANTDGQYFTAAATREQLINNVEAALTDAGSPFAPYFVPAAQTGTYHQSKPAWLTANANLSYQLHENASAINTGNNAADKMLPVDGLRRYINFGTDRDLLGNPRVIDGIDRGCYETWSAGTIQAPATLTATTDATLYGGHFYPHAGSVVYVQPGTCLVLATAADGSPLFTAANAVSPGYTLVRTGGSIYCQGNTFRTGYAALERNMPGQYQMVATPFGIDYGIGAVTTTTYPEAGGSTGIAETAAYYSAYTYDGQARADWRYSYREDESALWRPLAVPYVPANSGLLIDRGPAAQPATYRFTAFGAQAGDMVYTEDSAPKTVVLAQYDDRTSTSGGADFTNMYNMGWNMAGMPYLVADYRTGESAPGAADWQMNVPHLFYTMAETGAYRAAEESWAEGAAIAAGEAFFTQTAVVAPTETLTFGIPRYAGGGSSAPAAGFALAITDSTGTSDMLIARPAAAGRLAYTFGADGAKLVTMNPAVPQIYLNAAGGERMSLAASVPVETDLPLGVSVSAAGTYTISLPSPDSYRMYGAVWLTDRETGNVTNLLDSNCHVSADAPLTTDTRFVLRIGGMRPDGTHSDTAACFTVTSRGGIMTVSGIAEGDHVTIVTAGGATLVRTTAGGTSLSHPVQPGAVYVVVVNGHSRKAMGR